MATLVDISYQQQLVEQRCNAEGEGFHDEPKSSSRKKKRQEQGGDA